MSECVMLLASFTDAAHSECAAGQGLDGNSRGRHSHHWKGPLLHSFHSFVMKGRVFPEASGGFLVPFQREQVTKVNPRFANVLILVVGSTPCREPFRGIIRFESFLQAQS